MTAVNRKSGGITEGRRILGVLQRPDLVEAGLSTWAAADWAGQRGAEIVGSRSADAHEFRG